MITINQETCIGCGQCVKDCFPIDIELKDGKAVPKNTLCFECGHCVAVCPVNAITVDGHDMSEVIELKEIDTQIDPQTYLNHLKAHRSIRHFADQPVTEEQLQMILEAGRYSPTGGNRQNVAYAVVQDKIPEVRDQVIRKLKEIGDAMIAAGRRASFYTDMWLDMYEDYVQTRKDRIFFNAGTVIVISSDDPMSAGIAAAHMETMIYSLGLGMLYSGFSRHAVNGSPELRELLQIPDGYDAQAILVVGTPDVKYRRTVPRKKAMVTRV